MDSRSGALITHQALLQLQRLPQRRLDEDGRKANLVAHRHQRRTENLQLAPPTPQMDGIPALRRKAKRLTFTARMADASSPASGTE